MKMTMNRAQTRLIELKLKIPDNRTHEHNFLTECIKAWAPYDDMQYSYPVWQLRALEKKYGTTVADIKTKYSNHEEINRSH